MTEIETIETVEANELAIDEPGPPSIRERSRLLWIAAVVIILDQLSKGIIEAALPLYQSWAPIPALAPLFRFSHVSNTGAAFGLFPGGSSIFAWAAVIVAIAIVVYNFTLPAGQGYIQLALSLQLGGALGNFIDRMRIGHVTDFLDFGPWPVFNLADLSTVTGACLLAWFLWQEERKLKRSLELSADSGEFSEESRELVDEPNILDEWSTS